MTFDKLADRCRLFADVRKQLCIELLKEAELELTKQCDVYESTRTYTCDGSESYGLPTNYKQVILLNFDGDRMFPISEEEADYDSDGAVKSGNPRGYFIRNNGIHLNSKPASGTLKLSYYGTAFGVQDSGSDPSPIIPEMYHRDLCDYAIAIASAKSNPALHDKHFMLWNQRVLDTINKNADRELIHTIKEEI